MVTCSIIQMYDIPSTSHPNVHHTQDSSITEFILNGRHAGSDELFDTHLMNLYLLYLYCLCELNQAGEILCFA